MNQLHAEALVWMNLLIYSVVLIIILSLISRNLILAWLGESIAVIFLYYVTVFRSELVIAMVVIGALVCTLIAWKLKRALSKVAKKEIELKFVSVIVLFSVSYFIGINFNVLRLPWFLGFVLVTLSFVAGIILYRRR